MPWRCVVGTWNVNFWQKRTIFYLDIRENETSINMLAANIRNIYFFLWFMTSYRLVGGYQRLEGT